MTTNKVTNNSNDNGKARRKIILLTCTNITTIAIVTYGDGDDRFRFLFLLLFGCQKMLSPLLFYLSDACQCKYLDFNSDSQEDIFWDIIILGKQESLR